VKKSKEKIVFYDGECGFCNKSVQYILKYEKEHNIFFSPLQSNYTKAYFAQRNWDLPNLDTFVFVENETVYTKSAAAFRLAKHFKLPYKWIGVFQLLPEWMADQMYDFIAKNRKRVFKSFCVLPTPLQKKRFVN